MRHFLDPLYMLQIVAEALLCGLMLRTSVFNGVIVHYRVPQLS